MPWKDSNSRYRLKARTPESRSKPDPTNKGLSFTYANDYSWLHQRAMKLKGKGFWSLEIQLQSEQA